MDNKLITRNEAGAVKSLDEQWALMNAAMERLGHARRSVPASEIVTLACVCAVHEKPYLLRFTKHPGGVFRLRDSVKVEGKPGAASGGGSGASVNVSVPLEQFDDSALPCAWCGTGRINFCAGYCNAYVCGGRTVGDTFHCRKSCGASWVGVSLLEVPGQTKQPVRTQSMAAPPVASARRLLLGPGGSWGGRSR
jgi:hypothetical protein